MKGNTGQNGVKGQKGTMRYSEPNKKTLKNTQYK